MLGRLDRQRTLTRGTASLIWDEKGADDLMESYRALRTNVEFLMDDATNNVIEVTSPEPAQGKSTVVANLAVAFSRIGIPTIVLDADLRRPRQHEIFGLDNSSGLSNMLALRHKAELKPAGPGLWVITSGPVPPDPTEMLHIRLPSVIKGLRRRKALILVDTPPVLPVSDARLVAPLADGVILVATAGTQKPASFQAAIDRLALVDSRLLGVVLNKAGQDDLDIGTYYRYEATGETAERLGTEPAARVPSRRAAAAGRPADRERPEGSAHDRATGGAGVGGRAAARQPLRVPGGGAAGHTARRLRRALPALRARGLLRARVPPHRRDAGRVAAARAGGRAAVGGSARRTRRTRSRW